MSNSLETIYFNFFKPKVTHTKPYHMSSGHNENFCYSGRLALIQPGDTKIMAQPKLWYCDVHMQLHVDDYQAISFDPLST